MLELMKLLLGIDSTDTSKDNILNHYLNVALKSILGYCNVTELSSDYNDTIVDYSIYLYKNRDSLGYKQKTEGERSITFESGIPENIRKALPLPKVKVGGYDV
ncbi:phage head-tail connector protein [Clostridium sp. WILCCON 0269]|uniref:Phage head-tail connector protein n=1 Tax=Candidatus Clostridium eludens TaxID=3381663 RepID=A0ABW8SGY0_9CLOT